MINKVYISGKIDSEIESGKVGKSKINLTKFLVNNDGEKFTIVVWGNKGESLKDILTLNNIVFIEGKLEKNDWKKKDGTLIEEYQINAFSVEILN